MNNIVEFRGIENLVYAELTADTATSITYGEVKDLAAVAELSKTTTTNTTTKFYNNKPSIVINGEGADELTLQVAVIDLKVLADLTGKTYDEATGGYIDCERDVKYFAIGYKTKATDGSARYVWRLKGSFNIPDEEIKTEDDGTDANGQTLIYTGISTSHIFEKNNKSAKGVVVDDSKITDFSEFFEEVQTPDTLSALLS